MKTPDEIQAMLDRLEDDIHAQGWDASIDGAARALWWVIGHPRSFDFDAQVRRWMERPRADRRREWIARGGDPAGWPEDR